MSTSHPTRVDADVYASAQSSGAVHSRSAAQQITHWARIGRQFEAAVDHGRIARVLSGQGRYDGLDDPEQAVVRAEWDERTALAREGLDLAGEFAAAGRTFTEADPEGRAVTRVPAADGSASA